jgi:meromycolic acid enoyl-[acyl-carrier-protein] reductase
VGALDGILHAIAFAPEDALGGRFLDTPWDSAATAVRASAYSLKELVVAHREPLREGRGSVVSLDFDATVAWPAYDWMGVAKAALESVTRYLARDLGGDGIRVNCVAAGPLRTVAAKGIPGFDVFIDRWERRAPLGWDNGDQEPTARAVCALLSDLFPATTGEIVHVDGGFHSQGA